MPSFPRLVLVVDDDELERFFLRRTLESRGYIVEEAETADDALAVCRLAQPDAVITDYSLPGRTGIELCYALRDEPSTMHTPIALLTGSSDPGIRDLAELAGATIYLQKSPDARPIVGAISELLSSATPAASARCCRPVSQTHTDDKAILRQTSVVSCFV